ncbi:MAG TPA: hypothetical protein VD837_06930, partial [Terriglobales bacterium]|nr:hypothetical protein [Terriglobales bacterium]
IVESVVATLCLLLWLGGRISAREGERLEGAGFVTRKISGRRHEFTLTRTGKAALATWDADQGRFPTEFEDVLRTAFLTGLGKKARVADLFRQAAKARRRSAEELEEEAERLSKDVGKGFDLHAYLWLRARAEATRLSAEQSVLDQAARFIDQKNTRRK